MVEAQIDLIKSFIDEVLDLLNQNFNFMQDEVNEYKKTAKDINDVKISKYLETISKYILKFKNHVHEIQKYTTKIQTRPPVSLPRFNASSPSGRQGPLWPVAKEGMADCSEFRCISNAPPFLPRPAFCDCTA